MQYTAASNYIFHSCNEIQMWFLCPKVSTECVESSSVLSLSLLICICRTLRTAARLASWCVTSIRAVVTAASCIMWCTASWLPMAHNAPSYWSRRTGAMPPADGRLFLNPSVTLALTALGLPLDTGLVSNTHVPQNDQIYPLFLTLRIKPASLSFRIALPFKSLGLFLNSITVFIYLKCNSFFCWQSWMFSSYYSSVMWCFRNHFNMLICCSRNISYYYQHWKQLCCFIFLCIYL